MWKQFNNNPVGRVSVGDCVVRAASVALDTTWEEAFARLAVAAFNMGSVLQATNPRLFDGVMRKIEEI